MGEAEGATRRSRQGEGRGLNRRALLGGAIIAFAGLLGQAHAQSNFRQSGPVDARLFKVIDRIWRGQNLPPQTLKLGLLDGTGLRAIVSLSGQVWMTRGFVAACETEAQIAAWFCHALVALRTKTAGVALDRAALAALLAAGYDPREALKLWTRWAATEKWRNSSRCTEVPIALDRLLALRSEIEKLGYLL